MRPSKPTLCGSRVGEDGRHTEPGIPIALLLEAAQLAEVRGDRETLIDAARLLEALVRQLTDSVPALPRFFFSVHHRPSPAAHRTNRRGGRDVQGTNQPDRRRPMEQALAVTHQLASERDIEKLLRFIMDSAVLLCGAERGFYFWLLQNKPKG